MNKTLGNFLKNKYAKKPLKPMAQRREYRKMTYFEIEVQIKGRKPFTVINELAKRRGGNIRKLMIELSKSMINSFKVFAEYLLQNTTYKYY